LLAAGIATIVIRRRRQTSRKAAATAEITAEIVGVAKNKVASHFEYVFSGPNGDRIVAARHATKWLESVKVEPANVTKSAQLGDGRFGVISVVTVAKSSGRHGRAGSAVAKFCGAGADYDRDQAILFAAETFLAGALHHPNILPIVGAALHTIPMLVLTEHMVNGDLKSYLRACRSTSKTAKEKLRPAELMAIGASITAGCEYLESRKVVHRALMSSNVLVGEDHTDVKLTGFGSLREVLRADEYVKTSDTKDTDLDIRFMAIESFTDNIFSVKSDVWAFGIMLWEIMSFARKPYGVIHPTEIAAEVRAGYRLDRAVGCPTELHTQMERCWSKLPTDRPTFATLQGTMRLLLLKDADELRAKVAAAALFLPSIANDDANRWTIPMRGWEPTPKGLTDCGHFRLVQYRTVAATGNADATGGAVEVVERLGISTPAGATVQTLKSIFTVLQDLKHANVVSLLGCSTVQGFVILFEDCSLTLGAALHGTGGGADVAAAGYLEVDGAGGGPTSSPPPPPPSPLLSPPLLASAESKTDAALQMALGIEYLHARLHTHGRLSSAAFYFAQGGSTIKLLVGNVLHKPPKPALADAAPPSAPLPSNLRWLPYEVASGQRAPNTATDVYGFGAVLWELFADGGLPHSSTYPDDAALHAAIVQQQATPALIEPLLWGGASTEGTDNGQAGMLSSIFQACTRGKSHDLPWISGVVSILLDEGPERWEQDRRKLEFVEKLGSGQFGDVIKMSTSMFTPDGSLEFVAVKMLKVGTFAGGAADAGGYSAYAGADAAGDGDDADPAAAANAKLLRKEFLAECDLMKQFRHPNLVRMLGVCTTSTPEYMILEFLVGGSLADWLPHNGPKLLKPTCAKLVHILHQVALGFMELGRAGIIHRDLAARNVLIDENLQIKVADYGLSRDVEEDRAYYRIKTQRPMPLRW
jgi:serine/threonine protein kinase